METVLDLATQLIQANKQTKSKSLDLGKCGLTDWPKELFECIWLEELILSNRWWDFNNSIWIESQNEYKFNHLSSIPLDIVRLANLKRLFIGGDPQRRWGIKNPLNAIHIESLTYLDLSFNQIDSCNLYRELTNLTHLILQENRISDTGFLNRLPNLTVLDLGFNRISSIKRLQVTPKLTFLDLRHNDIPHLSYSQIDGLQLPVDFIEDYRKEVKIGSVYLCANSGLHIPHDVVEQGNTFILEYLLAENSIPLNECKVIITGRGGVGKTSLQKRLFGDEKFNPSENETHGIRKRTWKTGSKFSGRPISIHFWDMGGQQEQQTLHQLFYSDNSVYILLLDKRVDEDPEYFLELIKVYGNNCPVIIVINNKIDLNKPRRAVYNFEPAFDSILRAKYPNIIKTFGVCCGQDDDMGILHLKTFLLNYIPCLTHVMERYPFDWLLIKEELVTKIDKNYIKFEEYEALCKERAVDAAELQLGLAKMLNSTGVITFFDKPYLNYYILNPDWVTTGAYEIMLSPITAKNKGRITFKDLREIFKKQSIFKYNGQDYEFLMKLMLAFSLCHEFKENQEWLIPSSLQGQPDTNLVAYKEVGDYRLYCLKYHTSLPQSIIHKFIARNINYAYKQDYWRNGIVLKHRESDTLLFIEADYKEREIRAWIKGTEILEAWKFFRKDFIDLSVRFDYDEMVEVVSGENAMMSYKELLNLFRHLKKDQLSNWYNPQLNIYVDILKTLVMFDDKDYSTAFNESGYNEEYSLDMERKKLQIERNLFEIEMEEIAIRKWQCASLYILVGSLIFTLLLVWINAREFSFVMSPQNWKEFKSSDYFKFMAIVLGVCWNGFILKLVYDRWFDLAKIKVFREEWRRKRQSI